MVVNGVFGFTLVVDLISRCLVLGFTVFVVFLVVWFGVCCEF